MHPVKSREGIKGESEGESKREKGRKDEEEERGKRDRMGRAGVVSDTIEGERGHGGSRRNVGAT